MTPSRSSVVHVVGTTVDPAGDMMRNAMNANSGATGETDALVDELLPGYRKAAA